ncbi:MAG: N-acetylmannosamine-6-phosphate 2-epimerase [Ignavibacteria bacterium]|jgi:N-acylglucosamine-6-phosphate 2-epimerase|nr:N-acetylmannosamine-6-phosphate 2-epimerase [Ignavibacteria bacterium]
MNIFDKLKNGLIVSCQSEGDDPFNSVEGVTLFAKAAVIGGAVGIRSRELEKTKSIVSAVDVPVIGLTKSLFPDGFVRITGSFDEVENILQSGCHIIAVDGTFRLREGLSGPSFISEIKKRYDCLVMADIAEFSEGITCADNGADCISSTLSGYTPNTLMNKKDEPDYLLVERLAEKLNIPVIAEGKINSPEYAGQMIQRGAWAVVVGTAITRPCVTTKWFVDSIKKSIK